MTPLVEAGQQIPVSALTIALPTDRNSLPTEIAALFDRASTLTLAAPVSERESSVAPLSSWPGSDDDVHDGATGGRRRQHLIR